ncbi:translational GTPase TypA [Tuwongella immobilis]|uniref:Large ribosomal subunit assembly factor BipA n=1 Tax=Tuwongella immobilis TaxID=692036 RepID=A0A6C2YUY7_9BACT|nr:translational GTPase TypA [Tuwongella immobilis]VIP05177.1 gtp-binding protein : GTP-binding protein TypA OS=Pirellula staleyi (strain ATCC 27377 / DSM 6068 / ICPB 4128) GN=Psta_3371 PE=4 SV=1: GTP_EFTU: GTP_EFTU_D2: EFG_C [Tuwongella immobilis]VTS07710.1 gtp-binding protein : GTP-binding protein TypA OS=Pirellula staleyi (strain ATCC 27377 / DSM 6068 / ICPB 4128) GN=Psta_3371 PE=4 SV=1: GTP_EFTU: GTP_EFTU_D2: EFG_C [Tuwongella immobilis]
MRRNDIRNVAIIAHVDHGKTTLVDQMLRQSGLFRQEELDRLVGGQHGLIMDSNDLERERGITILAKNCAFKIGDIKVNLIDTPGHADFGGEVERVLKMADGAFVLVDAAEGPLPQTRFVLRKAFACGLRPIVIINKIDRPDARIDEVHSAMFDLFIELGADEETADFPVFYASGRSGYARKKANDDNNNLAPLYEAIEKMVPGPEVELEGPLQVQVSALAFSEFVGRIAIGKIHAGKVRKNQRVKLVKQADGSIHDDTIVQVLEFNRLTKVEVEELSAGDVVALVGIDNAEIGDTITDFDHPNPLPPLSIDEPTIDMVLRINDSPFASQDGKPLTSRELRDRLNKELESDVALRVRPSERGDEFIVSGRGLLHLSILLENMRREGSEFSVGKPQVINKEINGVKMEPVELLVVEAPASAVGAVMGLVLERQGQCQKMESNGEQTHLEFLIPARGLIGLRTRVLTATSGMAIMHHNFHEYQPIKGELPGRQNGVMISTETAKATAYAIEGLQERGIMFVGPMEPVYEGQIVAEHCRENDLTVNVTREKKLTNMRSAGAEIKTVLKPPRKFELESALEFIEDDELVEITPGAIRLRKMLLKESDRKRGGRTPRG